MTSSTRTPTIDFGPDGYRAGACNIGPAEIRQRRIAAVAAVLGTLGIAGFLVAADAEPVLRFAIVVPLYGAAVTVYQAVARFCVGFAMAGIANFGSLGSRVRIEDESARRADRAKAFRGIALSGVVAVAGAIAFALLPL